MDNVIIIIAKDENAAQDVKDALKKLEAGRLTAGKSLMIMKLY